MLVLRITTVQCMNTVGIHTSIIFTQFNHATDVRLQVFIIEVFVFFKGEFSSTCTGCGIVTKRSYSIDVRLIVQEGYRY